MRIDDLCLLIGAVSDNMATNMLLRRLGLDEVQRATRDLGFTDERVTRPGAAEPIPG